jgi:hypothetical protein
MKLVGSLFVFLFSFGFIIAAGCGDMVCNTSDPDECDEDCSDEFTFLEEEFSDVEDDGVSDVASNFSGVNSGAQGSGARVLIIWIAVVIFLGVGGFLAYRLIRDGGFTSSVGETVVSSEPAVSGQDVATEYPSA